MEIRDAIIDQRAEIRHLRSDVKELKEDKKRVIWGILAVVGSVAAGVFVWALNSGAKPLMLASLLFLPGCFSSNRQENTATVRTEERVGIDGGQPTQLTITTQEKTILQSETQSGVDLEKAVTGAVALAEGRFMKALAQLKPADPTPAGFDGTTAGLGLAAAGLGINALRDYLAKKALAKDRDEGWEKADAAHAREVELAKQLPPTKG